MSAPYSVVENIMVNKHNSNGEHNSKMYMQETKQGFTKRFHFLVFVEILKIGSDLLTTSMLHDTTDNYKTIRNK